MKKNIKIYVVIGTLLVALVILTRYDLGWANCIAWQGQSWCEDSTCNVTRNYNEFINYFEKYNCEWKDLSCNLSIFNNNLSEQVFGGYFIYDLLFMYTFPYTRFSNNCELLNGDGEIVTIDSCARIKLYQDIHGTYGKYKWKVYLPKPEEESQFSVGMFIYADPPFNDDLHEIDFECGYGKRSWWNPLSWWNDIYCYMTSQGNPEDRGSVHALNSGWHIFEIHLIKRTDGNYIVKWIIDGEELKSLNLNYGSEVTFKIYISVENLAFIGNEIPHKVNWVAFQNVKYLSIHYSNGNVPGSSCGNGMVYDCVGNCVSQSMAQSWIGDGYCDDGTYGMVLTCSAFNNDGGDCN